MTSQETYNFLMASALTEAKKAFEVGEVPVGAVISRGNEIIAANHNRVEELQDASAHAELLVLREASKICNNWRLEELTLCVTLEPCTMCIGGLINARVGTLVFGAWDKRAGACGSIYDLTTSYAENRKPNKIVSGIAEDQCVALLKDFFSKVRC